MTYEEELAWGAQESKLRIADLAVRTAAGLKAAQDNAAARRRAVGLSVSRAAELVIRANRQARIEGSKTP